MIHYRLAEEKDSEIIKELCDKHLIKVPFDANLIFIAIDDNGNLIGLCALKQEWRVEPLISSNPVAAFGLSKMIEGAALSNGIKTIRAQVDSDDKYLIHQYEKSGYEVVEVNKTILEK